MDIKFDTSTMNAIVTKAIVDGLGDEQRDLIIEQAVQALVTPPPQTGYTSRPPLSPIQTSFNEAARRICDKVAVEVLEAHPDFRDRVKDLMVEAAGEALSRDAAAWNGARGSILEALSEVLDRKWSA